MKTTIGRNKRLKTLLALYREFISKGNRFMAGNTVNLIVDEMANNQYKLKAVLEWYVKNGVVAEKSKYPERVDHI